MKKIYFAILALATLTLASCEKEPIGGTAVESMSGQWYVQLSGVDENGNLLLSDEDLFDLGSFHILTYNTAANEADSLWLKSVESFASISPLLGFLDYKVKVECDQRERIFNRKADDIAVFNGKILPGAATTPSGQTTDSIVYDISIAVDTLFAGAYYHHLRVSGYRYTGLANDEE